MTQVTKGLHLFREPDLSVSGIRCSAFININISPRWRKTSTIPTATSSGHKSEVSAISSQSCVYDWVTLYQKINFFSRATLYKTLFPIKITVFAQHVTPEAWQARSLFSCSGWVFWLTTTWTMEHLKVLFRKPFINPFGNTPRTKDNIKMMPNFVNFSDPFYFENAESLNILEF